MKIVEKKELQNTIMSDDILGKNVVDTEGEIIGVVEKIHIDPKKMELVGISVDKGIVKKGLAIGKDYINKVTDHAVLLNIKPSYQFRNMFVFDKYGIKVGKVADINLDGDKNDMTSLIVKTRVFKKEVINADLIDKIGHNIILKVEKNEINIPEVKL